MSLDARYIFVYDSLCDNLMEIDKCYLEQKYGGSLEELYGASSFFWDKPKYTLLDEEFKNLHCLQILEKTEDDMIWRIIDVK